MNYIIHDKILQTRNRELLYLIKFIDKNESDTILKYYHFKIRDKTKSVTTTSLLMQWLVVWASAIR